MTGPRIETARLVLRQRTHEDFPAYAAMWADPTVVRHLGGTPLSREAAWTKFARMEGFWALDGFGFFIIEDKATGRFLGEAGVAHFRRDLDPPRDLGPECGWALVPAAHGRGYASEATAAAIAWAAARIGGAKLSALVNVENRASARVAERCGFRAADRARYQGDIVDIFERPAR